MQSTPGLPCGPGGDVGVLWHVDVVDELCCCYVVAVDELCCCYVDVVDKLCCYVACGCGEVMLIVGWHVDMVVELCYYYVVCGCIG